MPTPPKYDPMSFAQITGGVPIPSWVFNEPYHSINDYQQQEQQIQLQDAALQAAQDKQAERQAYADARAQQDPTAAALQVMRQYEPEKAFAMDLEERRMKRQDERDQVQVFQGLMRENPVLAQAYAQQSGVGDRLGIGNIDLSQMGGEDRQVGRSIVRRMPDGSYQAVFTAPRDEAPERPRREVFYDTTLGRETMADLNDPQTMARFNQGLLQSQGSAPKPFDPEKAANQEISRRTLESMGIDPNTGKPISPPTQQTQGTTVEQKVAAATDAPKYREGQTAINPQTGERITFRNGQWQ